MQQIYRIKSQNKIQKVKKSKDVAHYTKIAGTHGSCVLSRLRRAGTIRNNERTIGELFFFRLIGKVSLTIFFSLSSKALADVC